jgi:hypothetical protein
LHRAARCIEHWRQVGLRVGIYPAAGAGVEVWCEHEPAALLDEQTAVQSASRTVVAASDMLQRRIR